MTAAAARGRFAAARVARLATADRDARPHLVPIVFAVAGDTVYSAVDAKPKRSPALRRLANVAANPRACLLVDRYREDWTQLWWIRLDGTGRQVTDSGEVARAVRALADKYPQYAERPPAGPVLAVDVIRWTGWSAA
jgi:PPOX class probable F420-dependent enzyme